MPLILNYNHNLTIHTNIYRTLEIKDYETGKRCVQIQLREMKTVSSLETSGLEFINVKYLRQVAKHK